MIARSAAFWLMQIGSMVTLLLALGHIARAEESYIDELRKKISPAESPGAFLESIRKTLPAETSQESYIEQLKKEHPENFTQTYEESWIKQKMQELPPKESGGAIAAVREGTSELKPNFQGEIRYTVGARYGASLFRDVSAVEGTLLRPFNELYSQNRVPDLTAFFEYQILRHESFASLGILANVGISYFHGLGTMKYDLVKPWAPAETFGQGMSTLFQFYMVPVTVALTYRLNLLHFIRPFVMAGPTGIFYFETRNDRQKGHRGFSKGFYGSAGVSILMDWISPRESWDAYQGWGVRHSYVTIEYGRTASVGSNVDFSVAGLWAGVAFEY